MGDRANIPRATLPPDLASLFREPCSSCSICEQSYKVYPRGSFNSQVMVVAEAPGKEEEKENCFLIGPAGSLFIDAYKDLGINADKMFLMMNVVLGRPHAQPGSNKQNRTPTVNEVAACSPNFSKILEAHRPKLIISLGEVATRAIIRGFRTPVSSYVGRFFPQEEGLLSYKCPIYVTWHPSYILRNPGNKKQWLVQLVRARDYILGASLEPVSKDG